MSVEASKTPKIKTQEAIKQEFTSFLKDTGLFDELYKTFVLLYEQETKPENPKAFLKQVMGKPIEAEEVNLYAENKKLKEQVEELTVKADQLQKQLEEIRASQ